MAKFRLTAHTPGLDTADSFANIALAKHNSDFATYIDLDFGLSFTIKGTNLLFDGSELIRGTIDAVIYKDTDGELLGSITDISASARKLHADNPTMTQFGLFSYLMEGNDVTVGSGKSDRLHGMEGKDRIIAGAGDDRLVGGIGNDLMTGGKGADIFHFNSNHGRDTITDFDSDGPQEKHDQLWAQDASTYDVQRDGRDTIVIFDNGSSVRLIDFKPSELDALDIELIQI